MTPLDAATCWAVLAPLALEELQVLAAKEWARDAAGAMEPPPWEAVAGDGGWNALVSRTPGSEGADAHFAQLLCRRLPELAVYALWLDPDRCQAVEWRAGKAETMPPGSAAAVAARAGFAIPPVLPPRPATKSAALVEGASLGEVLRALGEFVDEPWLRVDQGSAGVVISSTLGTLGTQAWDVAEALPSATVYFVQWRPDAFEVLVLYGFDPPGWFRVPAWDDPDGALADIKGETEPDAILRALGIPA